MTPSFLVPNRTVLLVSDDALYIYSTSSKDVKLVETVPWDAQNFVENVSKIIVKDCGKKTVLILNDMVEQHYRKERVLKSGVSAFDRSTMLKRRLNVAFSKYPVRAALPLKEKLPKVSGQPAANLFIFAAIPDTEQLQKSMSALRKSLASIAGLCLLPVESSDMVKALSTKCNPKSKSVWSVFVGYHSSGNLRQVVTKNGELALTRMSPFTTDASDTQSWSEEVNKEFKATMSYLSRFGFDPSQGLSVNIIAPMDAHETLGEMIQENCTLNLMTLNKAADILGMKIGAHQNQASAEILHVAWASRKTNFALPMKSGSVDKVHKPRQVALAATVLMTLGACFLSYQLLSQYGSYTETLDDIDTQQKRKTQLDAQLNSEVERKERMGYDVKLIQGSIAVYDKLEEDNIKALDLFKSVGRALGKNLRIDKVELEPGALDIVSRASSFGAVNSAPPKYSLTLTMTYPGNTDVDIGNQELRDLRDRLSMVLKDHDVQVTKFLKDYEYTEGLVVETGDLETQNLQQDFVAEITILATNEKKKNDGGLY